MKWRTSALALCPLWVDVLFPDSLYRLNLTMEAGDGVEWTPDSIAGITGVGVDEPWADCQGAACCRGSTQTCCR